jgi:hypothetical protein
MFGELQENARNRFRAVGEESLTPPTAKYHWKYANEDGTDSAKLWGRGKRVYSLTEPE